jgi:cell fate (sporulation/competence/biofilm development) regulator YlbF (YheA/YmcA/DUF963 family)
MNNLEETITNFSRAVRETKVCRDFQDAAQVYAADPAAQKLMNDFQMAQQELAILQEGNFSGQAELEEKYNSLLEQVRANVAINNLADARKKMATLVGDMAVQISNNIGFPFTLPPKKSCGCG